MVLDKDALYLYLLDMLAETYVIISNHHKGWFNGMEMICEWDI